RRDRRPFPTRRSSDLDGRYDVAVPQPATGQDGAAVPRDADHEFRALLAVARRERRAEDDGYHRLAARGGPDVLRRRDGFPAALLDRKSTRLNSSHVKI